MATKEVMKKDCRLEYCRFQVDYFVKYLLHLLSREDEEDNEEMIEPQRCQYLMGCAQNKDMEDYNCVCVVSFSMLCYVALIKIGLHFMENKGRKPTNSKWFTYLFLSLYSLYSSRGGTVHEKNQNRSIHLSRFETGVCCLVRPRAA